MPQYDLSPADLAAYRVTTPEPPELDTWWATQLAESRAMAKPIRITRHEPEIYGPLPAFDLEFSGADGDRIRGWYLRPPASADVELPTVVTFVGYGGGRGLPIDHTALPSAGFAVLVMDVRGQGGRWTIGATGDPGGNSGGPEAPGVMTRGIADPRTYYVTRLITDAVRAVEVAGELDGVDGNRIAVRGGSQGGGLALAAAALSGDAVKVCQADVPFLCDFQRAITLAGQPPYTEIAGFLAQHVDLVPAALDTLRYVDCALLARRITARCLLSVGLMDEVCPPSTVYAAFHEINAPKELLISPFGGHDVARSHLERQLGHLRTFL
ncbi:acetylxylan esterase [Amycolatopsis sp. CA-126428]|uniref:acetylxylan esterase n=1 Tax=Amycolatopsis sp. CA-126428 TaxID=2073158 RepID=UPI000CD048B3|nr:acetylxylan esterase [Amycolatopsis sp. CA-126428]